MLVVLSFKKIHFGIFGNVNYNFLAKDILTHFKFSDNIGLFADSINILHKCRNDRVLARLTSGSEYYFCKITNND